MNIGGFQKTSFIDYPKKVSAVVFTQGCNFVCPYCHNAQLIGEQRGSENSLDEVLSTLQKRKHLLQGLVITGGEPTLQRGLKDFCKLIKGMGYAIKLDTNGSNPDKVQELIKEELIDYVAMDIKADPAAYPASIGNIPSQNIVQSIALLQQSEIPHEFRIPCAFPFITEESLQKILKYIEKSPIYLQAVNTDHALKPDFFTKEGYALSQEAILSLQKIAIKQSKSCFVR